MAVTSVIYHIAKHRQIQSSVLGGAISEMKLWEGGIFRSHDLSNSCDISLNTNLQDRKYYRLGGMATRPPLGPHLLPKHSSKRFSKYS